MRIKRRLPLIFAVLAVAAVVALLVVLRQHAPPEPARLLPGADGFLYVNLQWVRRANIGGDLPAVSHDPEYQQFIEATGFQFERDLERVAFAIHYPPRGPRVKAGAEARFSEVFEGKIDGERLRAYLAKLATSVDNYRSLDIYNIPREDRILRVAILGVDTVAASNHSDPEVIRGIIDRSRKLASPFGGPALLRQYYKYVPLASLGWAIFRIDPAAAQAPPGAAGLALLFNKPAVITASVRYLGKVHFRGEAFTGSVEDAQRVSEQLGTFLSLFHTAEGAVSPQGTDVDVKAFFDSLRVSRQGDRAVLTATVPPGFIKKALASPPNELSPSQPGPSALPSPAAPAPAPPDKSRHK